MFQSFETPSHDRGAERLAALRSELKKRGLAGFIVPRADAHQGEYVPARDERLRWLTGFTGSAGLCVALRKEAAVFVDGRYTVQARAQLHREAFATVATDETRPGAWLSERLREGDALGFDPWLLTETQRESFARAAEKAGAALRAEPDNPVDAIWSDQPPPPMGSARPHPQDFAGVAHQTKREAAAERLREAGLDAFVLTLPDSINWLLNIRGGDIAHTPVALCFAILRADAGVDLFIAADKADRALAAHLGESVRLHEPEALSAALGDCGALRVGVEKATAPVAIGDALRAAGAPPVWSEDPCVLAKARKNAAEQAGARAAHLRDGAAMARFLAWTERQIAEDDLTEIKAAKTLEGFRAETERLEDISFDTISAFGPHAAMPHYRVSRETNLTLEPGSVFLIDSGGQYADGTTDITRTIAVGAPAARHVRAFTLVLKGMIAVSRARFPKGTTGAQIDVLAREALWRAGLDYDHGTGHGVGAFLGVHEGPARLAKSGHVALEPGMILSNEPGYYREGDFGIRIENLLLVSEAETPEGGERPMMAFETLTLAPIDLRLVDPALLTSEERDWLDRYHERVYESLYPLVDDETREWLEQATAPVGRAGGAG